MLPPKRKARPSFFIQDETFSTRLREATREYKREDEPLREHLGLFPQKIRKGRPLAVVVLDGPDDFETYTKNLCEELGFNYCNVELEYHRFWVIAR
ncbi:hypothetical protein A0H81_01927 [Grifola frondosa]|uniref:Uncharacterized protein n=1 Tax=Grifola frondosa TaxID=5627 RepID=A0A1C7MPA7_GRIFR|nr:hypothetical protein A0H81_01927 [Grifola frondosa]